jgi:SAM-dependent methyltransferase
MERLYDDLAPWWPLLSDPASYGDEATHVWTFLLEASTGPIRTLLELGSGGGNLASHLKHQVRSMTLVDRAPGMLAVSRALNPDCEHLEGDMRTVRLGERRFDAVLIHDAIEYMTTEADLRRALETAAHHCRPGGVGLFLPDCVRETFEATVETGGHDGPDGRGLRYLEWNREPEPGQTCYGVDFAYLLREADGTVRAVQDHHVFGLFPRDLWLDLLREVGFEPSVGVDPWERDVFVGVRL